jgi:hypothetical protein
MAPRAALLQPSAAQKLASNAATGTITRTYARWHGASIASAVVSRSRLHAIAHTDGRRGEGNMHCRHYQRALQLQYCSTVSYSSVRSTKQYYVRRLANLKRRIYRAGVGHHVVPSSVQCTAALNRAQTRASFRCPIRGT